MSGLFDPLNLATRIPIVLLALTVHEFAHAYAAYRLGDPTAFRQGRCTLNPLKHLDPLGTVCLMFAPIGWAKPVPVNLQNFDDPRRGDLITSAAGPGSNVVQAVIFALLLRAVIYWAGHGAMDTPRSALMVEAMFRMFQIAVLINVGLAVFNCLPIYPLDGFHITLQLTRPENQQRFMDTAHYGPFVIIGLVVLSGVAGVDILGALIHPPADLLFEYVAGIKF